MKTISIALQKGGTGKTSVAVSVASALAKKHKVVLVDADPQGNASAWYNQELTAELSDILTNKAGIGDALVATGIKNLFMIPTAGVGGGLNAYQKTEANGKPEAMLDVTDELSKAFDYCIIDTSPHFGPLEESCFIASDEVIPVMMIDRFSFDGLEIFMSNLSDLKTRAKRVSKEAAIKRLVLNAKDNRLSTQDGKIDALMQTLPKEMKLHIIPVDQAFKKAQDLHESIEAVEAKKETIAVINEIAKALSE
ncbi:MAG: ParA family protein [Treponema sp.]|nr:ParA family protein [Spirochaetia bacterium]MDD7459016.1 ParA family protein [Spirochaetales bacterium]MDY5812500.1 ParA family protein [Treponema sp.]MEE1180753.1 ParA family protein [Treponema sp.]